MAKKLVYFFLAMAIMFGMVNRQNYLDTYNQAVGELAGLIHERVRLDERRDEIDQRLTEVRKGVIALSSLCGMRPWAEHPEWFPEIENTDVGFTSAIRRVLQQSGDQFLTPVGVRDRLKSVGYEIKSKNILPSVHNTLKRLYKAGNAETEDIEGKTCYRWKGAIPDSDQFTSNLHGFLGALKEFSDSGLKPPPGHKRGLKNVRPRGKE